MSSRRKRAAGALLLPGVLMIAVLVISRTLREFPLHLDEGISLDAGWRVLQGQVPYRDFFHITTPGAAVLLALVFRLFGTTLLAARLLTAAALLSLLAALYALGKPIVRNRLLLAGGLVLMIFLEGLPFLDVSTHRFAVLFAILSLFPLERGGPWRAAGGGALLALSFLMNQNIGAFALAGGVVLVLSRGWFEGRAAPGDGWTRTLGPYLLGAAFPLAVFAVYLIGTRSADEFFRDAVLFPAARYAGFNRYPYYSWEMGIVRGDLSQVRLGTAGLARLGQAALYTMTGFLPLVVYPLALVSSFLRKDRSSGGISVIGLFLFLSSWTRPDMYHVVHTLPLFILLSVGLLSVLWGSARRGARLALGPLIPIALLLSFAGIDGIAYLPTREAHPTVPVRTEAGTCLVFTPGEASELDSLFTGIAASARPDDPIFVYHWSPAIYFLSGRRNPTGFDSYIPLYNTPDQLSRIIGELERSRPPVIVRDGYLAGFFSPSGPGHIAFPSVDPQDLVTHDTVDAYIRRHYEPAGRWFNGRMGPVRGPFTVLRPTGPTPGAP